jgi:hypothetical protein
MKNKTIFLSLILAATAVSAGKFDQPTRNALEASSNFNAPVVVNSTPNSFVSIDFGLLIGDSWDGASDTSNVVANCISGGSITGVEWTGVTVESVGGSWLSEASIGFSDSSGTIAVNLSVGAGDDAPGVATYSSGAIIDLSDNGIPDIVPLGDGVLRIELFEGFDDAPDAIDANYTAGTVDVHGIDLVATAGPGCGFVAEPRGVPAVIPSLQWYGLVALMLVLLTLGYRRVKA